MGNQHAQCLEMTCQLQIPAYHHPEWLIYIWMCVVMQDPSHNIRVRGWADVQRAIAEDYQVRHLDPAHLVPQLLMSLSHKILTFIYLNVPVQLQVQV